MSDKRELLLDTAETLISRNGYRNTTTRMIAADAGVNVAMLSYYFGSKEKLLKALLDRHTTVLRELFERISSTERHPVEAFRQFLFAFIDYSFDNPKPVIIAIREIGLLNQRPDILENLQRTMLEVNRMFVGSLEKSKKEGILRNIDIELSVLTLSSTIESCLVNAFMFETEFPFLGIEQRSPEEMKRRLKEHLSALLDHMKNDS